MIESKDIRNMVEHVIRRQRGVTDREPMDPAREWVTGIVITLLFVCIGGIVSYRYYNSTITWQADMDSSTIQGIPYNPQVVEEALTLYESKAARYRELRGSNPALPVESLSIVVPDVTATATATSSTDATTSDVVDGAEESSEISPPVTESVITIPPELSN